MALLYQAYASFFEPLPFLIDSVFERDDAFYYFKIAQNVVETGRPTFDGIHLTNGVQLLWHYVLVVLAFFVRDDGAFLRAVLLLCIALNLYAGLMLRSLGRLMLSRSLGDIALFLWSGVLVERWNTLQGMEFSLHIVIILGIALVTWRILVERRHDLLLALSALLTLNFWTRLDSAIFSLAIWAVVLALLARRKMATPRALAALTFVPFLGAIAYVATSYAMAGTPLPLSGAVKSFYTHRFFGHANSLTAITEEVGWWIKIQSTLALSLVPQNISNLSADAWIFATKRNFLILAVGALASAWGIWRIGRVFGWKSPNGSVAIGCGFVWVVSAVHLIVTIREIGDFSHVSRHYYAWLLVFWLVWGALLISMSLDALKQPLGRMVSSAAAAGLVVCYGALAAGYFSHRPDIENYAIARFELAKSLNQTLPKNAIVGAWNAGVLGYFLDRPTVDLDGLVNDAPFLDFLKSDAPFQEYLANQHVTHLIDHNGRDLTLNYGEERDTVRFFRDGIPWTDVEQVGSKGGIYVLRIRPTHDYQ